MQPSHQLLAVSERIFPVKARDPQGRDCTERLLKADRVYAYEPELDRRFFGFCRRHTLELDFGEQLTGIPAGKRVTLFINGYLEYPYSQTAYAAGQAGVTWEPIRIERLEPGGTWRTIVPDAGAFGGMGRTMTVDLTGLLTGPSCRLRLSSNLEIFYDQVFLASEPEPGPVQIHPLSLATAELRYSGFAREFSPDGRLPLIYDYELRDATAPFHTLSGAYTRYGSVSELLQAYDDLFVLVGPGDEIALKYEARALPETAKGMARSFILVSRAYCKDMDLYTATPQTLDPLPFKGMTRYPYPASESYPETAKTRGYRQTYNTRVLE
jgi:hypothetical protein